MLRLLLVLGLTLAVGFALGFGVFHAVHRDHLRYMGELDALGTFMDDVRREFGEHKGEPSEGALFSLKTSDALIVTVHGVKTLRYRD